MRKKQGNLRSISCDWCIHFKILDSGEWLIGRMCKLSKESIKLSRKTCKLYILAKQKRMQTLD